MIQKEKKESYNKDICYAKTTKKNDRNIVRKNCFENASLSQMNIVEDFSFKKNDKFNTIQRNI